MCDYEAVFQAVASDPRYLANLDWGRPRPGHPEGTIRAHIQELERNLEILRPRPVGDEFAKLKILVHAHDLFKPNAKLGVAASDPAGHAGLACAFLKEFCDDPDLLDAVLLHDEPYALWRQYASKGTASSERLERIWRTIKNWDLYLAFLIIDGCTQGKKRAPLQWFFRMADERVSSRYQAKDIL